MELLSVSTRYENRTRVSGLKGQQSTTNLTEQCMAAPGGIRTHITFEIEDPGNHSAVRYPEVL